MRPGKSLDQFLPWVGIVDPLEYTARRGLRARRRSASYGPLPKFHAPFCSVILMRLVVSRLVVGFFILRIRGCWMIMCHHHHHHRRGSSARVVFVFVLRACDLPLVFLGFLVASFLTCPYSRIRASGCVPGLYFSQVIGSR